MKKKAIIQRLLVIMCFLVFLTLSSCTYINPIGGKKQLLLKQSSHSLISSEKFSGLMYVPRTQAYEFIFESRLLAGPPNATWDAVFSISSIPQAAWVNTQELKELISLISDLDTSRLNVIPVIVIYYIPKRDCNSYSAGGATNSAIYLDWIRSISESLAGRRTIIILEPDALASAGCLNIDEQNERFQMLKSAISLIKNNNKDSIVYLDAGNAMWLSPLETVARLKKCGAEIADGISLNASHFCSIDQTIAYASDIEEIFGKQLHYVIDTSRNGLGPPDPDNWCNPTGRALGPKPAFIRDNTSLDGFLWVKNPGESDGECNGAPPAGTFVPEYAAELYQNALKK